MLKKNLFLLIKESKMAAKGDPSLCCNKISLSSLRIPTGY